jgi:hypothetical protein
MIWAKVFYFRKFEVIQRAIRKHKRRTFSCKTSKCLGKEFDMETTRKVLMAKGQLSS